MEMEIEMEMTMNVVPTGDENLVFTFSLYFDSLEYRKAHYGPVIAFYRQAHWIQQSRVAIVDDVWICPAASIWTVS